MPAHTTRLDVSRMAHRLSQGYYSFVVAHYVAVNPFAINLLPPAKVRGSNPTGELARKDGTTHELDLRYYLDLLREDRDLQHSFLHTWAMGALSTLGDELASHHYFDRAPILELVYHLRNGVAHGNRFNITDAGKDRLKKHPAHNMDARVKSPKGTVFEITPTLSGPVLFDFIGAADVIDVLQSVELHLAT
jgi:hypothetical protein